MSPLKRRRPTSYPPSPLLAPAALAIWTNIATSVREPLRLQLLAALLHSDRTVTALVHLTQRSQPTVSKNLRVLRDAGIVTSTPIQNRRLYSLNREDRVGRALGVLLESLEGSLPGS
jgi:DNA-binding transcriptional ArsR family regulator